jgi:phage terminase large subunit
VRIQDYIPHQKQQLLHKDKHPVKVFLCGVGTGKTLAAVVEAFYQATVNHPGKIGIMAAPTYPLLVQGLLQTWQDTIPAELYQYNSMSHKMVLHNGSTIYWRSTSNSKSLQAINAAWCCFDEAATEPTADAFNELMSRLRAPYQGRKTQMILTTTPNGSNWLPQTFGFGPNTPGFRSVDGTQDYWEDILGHSCVIRARTWDNPLYTEGSDYLNMKLNGPGSSPEYVEQYIKAEFTSRTGLVFSRFDSSKHVITQLPTNIRRYIIGHDFGFSGYGAAVVFAETTDNNLVAVEEQYHKGLTSDEQGWFPIFESLLKKYRPEFIVCDSASPERIVALRRRFTGRTTWIESRKDTLDSINRGQRLFNEDRFLIHNSCHNLIRELQNWAWRKDRNGNPIDVPEQGNDHASDALRYCVNELSDWFMTTPKTPTPVRYKTR